MTERPTICVVAAVNDDALLAANLARSPAIVEGALAFKAYREALCAGEAYNRAIDETPADVLVFARQDVYLPRPWLGKVADAMARLDHFDPAWAVLGAHGVDASGNKLGHVWCSGLRRELYELEDLPSAAVSFDDLLIILRRSSGLRFDVDLPGFHLYGTDIARAAMAKGLAAYVIDAPVVHNTRPVTGFSAGHVAAFRYLRRKYAAELPVWTPICAITRFCMPFRRVRWRAWKRRAWPGAAISGADPAHIAAALGYE